MMTSHVGIAMNDLICVLYYKHITIINDNSSVVNKFEASLTDDARVIIYDCHMSIVQTTEVWFINLVLFVPQLFDAKIIKMKLKP
jgi:hypothetical protein